jgi:hypothetical protein
MARTVAYTEIRADADGVSHFAVCEIEVASGDVAPGMAPMHRSAPWPARDTVFITAEPGWEGGWHQPPGDGFVFVLAGQFEIETGDGERRTFGPGAIWRHRDRAGRGHNTRVVSDESARCVLVNFPDGD